MDKKPLENSEVYYSTDTQGIMVTIVYTIVLTAVMWGVSSFIS